MSPEILRLLEILRPLWPGLVQVASGEGWLILRDKRVQVKVDLTVDLWQSIVCCGLVVVSVRSWRGPQYAAPFLKEQAEDVQKLTRELSAALGLEVADG